MLISIRQRSWAIAAISFAVSCSLLVVSTFSSARVSHAGQYNSGINIGDAAPAWKDLPGVDDKSYSLEDFKDKDVLVVVFTCNTCPYAVDYEDRINRLAERFSASESKAAVVAINVNQVEGDLMPAMQKRAKERGFKFPYLYDESQKIAKAFGAARTPEFFVLDKARKIVYMGAMDDNTKEASVKTRYVEDAIEALMKGQKPAVTETPPVGCAIRWARNRR